MQIIILHRSIRIPSLKFVGLPILKIWLIFGPGIKQSGDLTFDFLTSKWGHGSLVSWALLLSIFSLLPVCPSILDLGLGMGQTDRRKERQWSSLHYAPYGIGGKILPIRFKMSYNWWTNSVKISISSQVTRHNFEQSVIIDFIVVLCILTTECILFLNIHGVLGSEDWWEAQQPPPR